MGGVFDCTGPLDPERCAGVGVFFFGGGGGGGEVRGNDVCVCLCVRKWRGVRQLLRTTLHAKSISLQKRFM